LLSADATWKYGASLAQELEGIAVAPSDDWNGAFLRQFRRLRSLSLFKVESRNSDDRELLVDNLPESLERLRLTMVSPVQVLSL